MKCRTLVHFAEDWLIVDYAPYVYLAEGARMKISSYAISPIKKITATIDLQDEISSDLIGKYEETRYCHNGETTFDFSAYIEQIYEKNIFRLIPYNQDGSEGVLTQPYYRRLEEGIEDMPATNIPIKAIRFVFEYVYGGTNTYTIDYPFVVFDGANPKQEDLCDTRKHLLPINFPSVYEFTPATPDVILTMQFDNGDDVAIGDEVQQILRTKQVNLTNLIDERYDGDFRTLKVSCPNHISTQIATNEVLDITGWVIGIYVQAMKTNVREDIYIVDKRTKGAFLRFIDRFGYVQQILLDIQSEETTYQQKTTAMAINVNDSGYLHLGRQLPLNYNFGTGDIVKTDETRILHCYLESITNEIKADLEDLCCSTCIAMLEVQDGVEYWQNVNVTCQSINEDKRKGLLDYKCDILIGRR